METGANIVVSWDAMPVIAGSWEARYKIRESRERSVLVRRLLLRPLRVVTHPRGRRRRGDQQVAAKPATGRKGREPPLPKTRHPTELAGGHIARPRHPPNPRSAELPASREGALPTPCESSPPSTKWNSPCRYSTIPTPKTWHPAVLIGSSSSGVGSPP